METTLKEILAVSGYSGLFKFISQGRHGVIVESIVDGKRVNIPVTAKVSALADIAIFTDTNELPLREVLKKIETLESGKPAIDAKSDGSALKAYFEQVVPDYDREKVYTSDIKKLISWYNLLQGKDLLELLNEPEETKEENSEEKKDEKTE
ncbi:MAG: DUF5606 domain-containing protein [Bacteroidales bacterium]|nr:DUF5606 domain-containing protein [Bacteroidales bacterium]HPD95350.1 DUF5606 domain-containing protein [Tenuifilaceae bacterium]HRX30965.1 DUF5606 domain-containing protein [Tenuifilaceae bacterium]